MFRIIRLVVLGFVLAALVLLALANRAPVNIALLPDGLPLAAQFQLNVPLFAVVFVALFAGLLLGMFYEYFREHKHRRAASQNRRQAKSLASEVARLKGENGEDDDVLALLN